MPRRLGAPALALLSLLTAPAFAHGPWPWECCHDRDCAEVDPRWIAERDGAVMIRIPPGGHPMWPADGRPAFEATIPRDRLRRAVTGEWGVCIDTTGKLLCVFPPAGGV